MNYQIKALALAFLSIVCMKSTVSAEDKPIAKEYAERSAEQYEAEEKPNDLNETSKLVQSKTVADKTDEDKESSGKAAEKVQGESVTLEKKVEDSNVQYPNGVAAIVDTHVITMDDLHRRLGPFIRQLQRECTNQYQFQERLTPLAQEVLDNMINDVLLVNSFKADKKLRVPESFLENHYSKFIGEHFQGNRSNYLEYLAAEGKTDREVREQQKEEVIIGFLRGRMRRSEATISPAKIKKYYEENLEDFTQKEEIHLRQIVLQNSSDAADEPVARNKIQEVVEQLKKGQPFVEVAKKFSEDGMEKSGGDLGWITRSDIRKELADVAFSLSKSQFSDPVVLNNHTFILFIEDKKTAGQIPLEKVSEKIEKTLADKYAKQSEDQYVKKLREKAHIKYYL